MSPRATTTSSAVVRTVSSVPRTPTAVVTPPAVIRLNATGGTRVFGPASPPPPVRCTWPSTRPGITRRPSRSTSSTPRPAGSAGRAPPTHTTRSSATRRCARPRGVGSYSSQLESRVSTGVMASAQPKSSHRPRQPLRRVGQVAGAGRDLLGRRVELLRRRGDLLGGGRVVFRPRRHLAHAARDALDQSAHLARGRRDAAGPLVVRLGLAGAVAQAGSRRVGRILCREPAPAQPDEPLARGLHPLKHDLHRLAGRPGRPRRLSSQLAHFLGDHAEALALLAGPRG